MVSTIQLLVLVVRSRLSVMERRQACLELVLSDDFLPLTAPLQYGNRLVRPLSRVT